MMEMEASPQREDEVNHPPTAPNTVAAPGEALIYPLDGQQAVDRSAIVAPPAMSHLANSQATISVPAPNEPDLIPLAAMPEPIIAAPPAVGPVEEGVAASGAGPEPFSVAPPAVELTPPVPEDAPASLPIRPASAPPVETQAATEAAALLIPDGGLVAGDEAQPLSRRGRIELLPNEEIIYHLGALYLTNKRVLLYAPTVLRAAFLRDVDAMGMATERLSSGVFIVGLLMMVAAGLTGLLIFFDARGELAADSPLKSALVNVRDFLPVSLEWVAVAVAALGLFFVVSYFLYVNKSLFVSVHGRPLITVSISGYRPRNLDEVDNFINALAAAKDATISDEG